MLARTHKCAHTHACVYAYTNERKHTSRRLKHRKVDAAFQWHTLPRKCGGMLRSDVQVVVGPSPRVNHWEAHSTLWWFQPLETLKKRCHKNLKLGAQLICMICVRWSEISSIFHPKQKIRAIHWKIRRYKNCGPRKKVGSTASIAKAYDRRGNNIK